MFNTAYTVISKTDTLRSVPSVELQRDPDRVFIGQHFSRLDLPESITLQGVEAEALNLGDRLKLTLEKMA